MRGTFIAGRPLELLTGALLTLSLSGCGSDAPASAAPGYVPTTPSDYPVPGVENARLPGDPLWEAQWYNLYETWGGERGGWQVAFLLDVLAREPEVFGPQFEKFGFVPDPNDDLPLGFKRGTVDPTRATTTCAPCHTGRLPDGRVWFGQPNRQIDVPGLDRALDERWRARGNPSALSAVFASRAALYGPGRFRVDSDEYDGVVAANIPVHYQLSQRTRLSMVGGARNVRTDVYLSIGAQVGFPLEGEPAEIPFPPEALLDQLTAFMGAHEPPPAPAQDAALVTAGRAVFEGARCNTCHHPEDPSLDGVTRLDTAVDGRDRIPGDDPEYPTGSVHADPLQYFMAYGDPNQPSNPDAGIDPRTVTIFRFAQQHELQVGATDGYTVLNLRGLWASAPYLNNGSVPTLEDLLSPASERPARFLVEGWEFDVTRPGDGNIGHEFGVALPAADKAALIAYLHSL